MGKICTFCKYKRPENRCALIFSNASVKQTERCCNYEPVKDVTPVIHAHWEITKLTAKWTFLCSHCRYGLYESYEGEDIAWKYCPDCGAIMDEEVSE